MRANIEDVRASALHLTDLFRMSLAVSATPANNFQLSDPMPPFQLYDVSSGGSKNILLPALTARNKNAIWHIGNSGASNNVVVKTSDSVTTVATIVPGTAVMIINDGTTFYAFVFSNVLTGAFVKALTLVMPFNFADLVNTTTWKLAVPFDFTVNSVGVRVGKPATTGSKAATATGQIAGTPMTGGVISLTSATLTPTGTLLAGSSVTALNTGNAGDTVEMAISSVTTFVEGNGWFEIKVSSR